MTSVQPIDSFGVDYCRVRPNGNVSYDSFNGDIEFNVNNSESERWISPKNSYLSIRLRIVHADETGAAGLLAPIVNTDDGTHTKAHAALVSIPYISPNPAAALFSAVTCNIGEETTSNNQNISQCNTLYRTLYESRLEQDTVNFTNPIKCMSIYDTDVTANKSSSLGEYFSVAPITSYPNTLANFTNRKLFALKNMMGFNKYNEIEINTQCLAPLMYSDDLIPPNTPFSLRFTVDTNCALNIISIAGSNICAFPNGGAVNYTVTSLTGASTFKSPNANNYNTMVSVL